jgi:hypothetical protein
MSEGLAKAHMRVQCGLCLQPSSRVPKVEPIALNNQADAPLLFHSHSSRCAPGFDFVVACDEVRVMPLATGLWPLEETFVWRRPVEVTVPTPGAVDISRSRRGRLIEELSTSEQSALVGRLPFLVALSPATLAIDASERHGLAHAYLPAAGATGRQQARAGAGRLGAGKERPLLMGVAQIGRATLA